MGGVLGGDQQGRHELPAPRHAAGALGAPAGRRRAGPARPRPDPADVTLAARSQERLVALGWALLAAGWASNWLDRLGLSALTQSGSPRGAVAWVRISGVPGVYNLADGLIVAGGLLLAAVAVSRAGRGRSLLAVTACLCLLAVWSVSGPATGGPPSRPSSPSSCTAPRARWPRRSRRWSTASAGPKPSRVTPGAARRRPPSLRSGPARRTRTVSAPAAPVRLRRSPPLRRHRHLGGRRRAGLPGAPAALGRADRRARPAPCDGSLVQVLCGQVATAAVDEP